MSSGFADTYRSHARSRRSTMTWAGIFAMIVTLVIYLIVASLMNGYVISELWRMFAVPLGIPSIGVAHAIGLSTLIGMFTSRHITDTDKDNDGSMTAKFIAAFISLAISAGVALLIGTIIYGYMPR